MVRSYENPGSLYMEQGKLEEALRVFLAGAEGLAAKPGDPTLSERLRKLEGR